MSDITFHCPECNQELEAPAEMAGEDVPCPACESQIKVPQQKTRKDVDLADISIGGEPIDESKPEEEPVAEEEASAPGQTEEDKCPNCDEAMEAGAVLCVNCGYHKKMGKVIETDLS
jgi:Zn finger protein HypA/HybF involved in hydrogenase expression